MRKAPAVIGLLLILGGPASLARGGEDTLYRALEMERTEDDPEGALALFKAAADTRDPDARAAAMLGMARCLRRLGRPAEARDLLEAMLAGPLPPDAVEGARSELERNRSLLAAARAGEPAGNGDQEEERRRAERERAHRAELTAYALSQARALFREGRMEEAREWVLRALTQDPASEEARELLVRLGRTPGARERLTLDVLRLLDLERQVRFEETQRRADALLAEGEELLLRGDPGRAAERFLDCLDFVDARPAFRAGLLLRRERAGDGLRRAALRGADPEPRPAPAPVGEPGDRFRETLRSLLADLVAPDLPGGRRLSIHSLAGFLDPAPREAARPGQFGQTARRPPPGPLFALAITGLLDPGGWGDGGNLIRLSGEELLLVAPDGTQAEVAGILRRAAARQDPPVRLRFEVIAAESPAAARAAAETAARFETSAEGARAVLLRSDADRFRDQCLRSGEVLGETRVEVPPERTEGLALFRPLHLISGTAGEEGGTLLYGVALEVLPLRTGEEVALAILSEVTIPAGPLLLPSASGGERQVPSLARERASAAVRLAEGHTLVLAGLRNPFAARGAAERGALFVFVTVEGELPSVPAASPPPPAGPVAVDLLGLDREVTDEPSPPFRGEAGHAPENRAAFLLSVLRERFGAEALAGTSLSPGVVWVEPRGDLPERVRAVLAELKEGAARIVDVRVRAASISSAEEATLLRGLAPGGIVLEGDGVRAFLLAGEDRRRLTYFAAGAEGRIPLLTGLAAARSTQIANIARVARTTFLRELRQGEGGRTWPVYDCVDEGLAVDFRPVLLPAGTVDLFATARVARVLDAGGEAAGSQPPVLAVSLAEVRATLRPEEALLVTGLPAPTPVRERRDRLLVLLEAALR
ncbi:MAG: tetratricopeptide repeat protein [Planctomycetes bacterium]|jgi:tetratricopeptide (TPR) repeat protein|nr:tetratricopeptide repeat protein [Planctomycetota bacterium]